MKHTLALFTGLLVLAAGTFSATAAVVTVPPGLNPGDMYRLVFVTDSTLNATSSDISVYNTFVTTAAAPLAAVLPVGTVWTAIASTGSIDAVTNTGTTGTGVPIYGLDGGKVADTFTDLWDGSLDSGITKTPYDNTKASNLNVWTGTTTSGGAYPSGQLGAPSPIVGRTGVITSSWVSYGSIPQGSSYLLYGISSDLTVIPEPTAAYLSFLALGLVTIRRRRSSPSRT